MGYTFTLPPLPPLQRAPQIAIWPSLSFISLLLLSSFTNDVQATQPFNVPWSDKHFGPDGPWQAVEVRAGGDDPSRTMAAQGNVAFLQLYPGGQYASITLDDNACLGFAQPCAQGGTWTPAGSSDVQYPPNWVDSSWGLNSTNNTLWNTKGLTIGNKLVFNVSLASVKNVSVTNPDNSQRGISLGTLALGIDTGEQYQSWGVDNANASAGVINAWQFSGYLYNQSEVASYSYGLHIGAARYNYSGSLLFGGYDKGRAIGPYATYNTASSPGSAMSLLDIEIGVEVGGSPFDFSSKSGLLLSEASKQEEVPIRFDPTAPYMALPGPTCDEIAKHIPVTFNTGLGYYLWNTQDPQYNRVVSSPAYLKFIFPPASGKSDQVGIKVPFALLNLTLESPITEKPVSYFPCRSFKPGDGDTHRLGRAFLQAAFVAQNYNTRTYWVAHAPGPGDSLDGLGSQIQEIEDGATDIELFEEDGHFARSWQKYWTQLPSPDATTTATPSPSATSNTSPESNKTPDNSTTLSTAAKIGVAVGGAALLSIIVALLLFCVRRRKQKRAQANHINSYTQSEDIKYDRYGALPINPAPSQLPDGHFSPREMGNTFVNPPHSIIHYELPGNSPKFQAHSFSSRQTRSDKSMMREKHSSRKAEPRIVGPITG